ncbi:MAG TPA: LacI family DNA-binding transcriptional regulator [Candidatus Ventricola gallistercoris]|nr:LacI family DNA-binding transcriptional regulator [Candidatus Ventricola gallistercoris]
MDKKTTIYDIAREAGVSTATVTRVTAGSAKVKPSTRERVQRVIDAHGYVPSAAAHALEGGLSNTIAIVMPLSANPYFTRLFNAVYEEAAANGYYAWLFQIRENSPIPRSLIDEIIRRRIDGVIFAGGIWSEERSGLSDALTRLKHHMPAVTICPPTMHPDCICIHSDLVSCSRLPVRHLHALGHRRIAFIGGSLQLRDSSMRGENFLRELRELGLPDDPAYHVDCGYNAESGEGAVLRMLSGLDRRRWPTAIIAFNDLMALGAIKQLKHMGLHLPQDMAIIGCDNQFFCPYVDPPLTSVDLHPEELASSAVRELLAAKGASYAKFNLMRDATLIVRESCGASLGYRKLG